MENYEYWQQRFKEATEATKIPNVPLEELAAAVLEQVRCLEGMIRVLAHQTEE